MVLFEIKKLYFGSIRIIDFHGKITKSLKTERIFIANMLQIFWLDRIWVVSFGKLCFRGILEDKELRIVLLKTSKLYKEIGGIKLVDNNYKKQSSISFI